MSLRGKELTEKGLLDKAAEAVYAQLENLGGDPLKLSPVVQPVAILYTVQAIVDNGGFRYLFENEYDEPYSVFAEAYRTIGAHDAADFLERAVARFPFKDPHNDRDARLEFMDTLDETDEMFELGVCRR
jgi:hypothetical protein